MKRIQLKETKPFRPFVTLEHIEAFDSSRPETFTPSPFVNAVLEALDRLPSGGYTQIAPYLGLDTQTLSTCLRVATGMNFTELKKKRIAAKVERLRQERPELSPDELAAAVGYSSRSAIWKSDGQANPGAPRPHSTKHLREWEELRLIAEKSTDPAVKRLYERLMKKYNQVPKQGG